MRSGIASLTGIPILPRLLECGRQLVAGEANRTVTLKMCQSVHLDWRKANGSPCWRSKPDGFDQRR